MSNLESGTFCSKLVFPLAFGVGDFRECCGEHLPALRGGMARLQVNKGEAEKVN
jgi:hypothetical protein